MPRPSCQCLAMLALLMTLVIGCRREEVAPTTQPATRPGITIGYSAPEWGGAQFFIMDGLRKRAEARGWKVLVVNANFDADTQLRQIDYLIERRVSAIVCVPLHSEQIASHMTKAQAQGIPFYTIDRAPSEGRADLIIQADNILAGQQAGEDMIRHIKQRKGAVTGTILVLQGELTQTVAQERDDGFNRAVADHPGLRIIRRETHWHPNLFGEEVEKVLRETQLDGIYLQSDVIGVPEVLPVLKRMGKLHPVGTPGHICIVGVDGGASALQAIRDGFVDGVAAQPLTDYGIVADWIGMRFHGQAPKPGRVVDGDALWAPAELIDGPNGMHLQLRTTLVTKDNVDDPRLWGNQIPQGERRSK